MSNKKLPKEYSVYAKETIDKIYTMLKTKSKEDIKDRALKSLHNALVCKSENARLLLSDENFLKVCKEELDLVPNDEIIFLDDLLKGYEELISKEWEA